MCHRLMDSRFAVSSVPLTVEYAQRATQLFSLRDSVYQQIGSRIVWTPAGVGVTQSQYGWVIALCLTVNLDIW